LLVVYALQRWIWLLLVARLVVGCCTLRLRWLIWLVDCGCVVCCDLVTFVVGYVTRLRYILPHVALFVTLYVVVVVVVDLIYVVGWLLLLRCVDLLIC